LIRVRRADTRKIQPLPPSRSFLVYLIIFGVFNLCMLLHVTFPFPETAGKTLEEVQLIFEDPNGLPYIGTPAWKTHKATSGLGQVDRGRIGPKGFEDDEKSLDEPANTVKVKGV
jgi:hypothetical protein